MAAAVEAAIGPRLRDAVLTADAAVAPWPNWRAFPATHPKPGAASEAAGRAALDLADRCRRDGALLLVCLSGGASAMLAVPADGLTIDEKSATTAALLAAGIDIGALNLVRRHLSAVKGGQLAARAGRCVTLAISDVCTPVEDDPRVIGSGPTVGDESSFADALAVITGHDLASRIPAAALRRLEAGVRGEVAGPVPPDDPALRASAYWIVAARQDAMRAAAATAARLGYHVHVEAEPVIGEARLAAGPLVARAAALRRPACLISSGETTVRVRGTGRGGRNQELALAAIAPLAALGGERAALASLGTDGVDGPTDAAGAFVDGSLWRRLGDRPAAVVAEALEANDAYPVLDRLGALIRSGPTGTNVGDLQVVLLGEPPTT